jgi:(E)-4-hydroxy-3-methylbut-2-enyl-diphosphate synthase
MSTSVLELPPYVGDRFAWQRRLTRAVRVGELTIGGTAPIVVQSMCTTPTQDVAATIAQCIQLAEAGCQLVRVTAPGVKDAQALRPIRAGLSAAGFAGVPLVADIHFMPKAAMEAIEHVEKVRINPGNFADKKSFAVHEYSDSEYAAELERIHQRFAPLARRARELGRALRIGVNHGSLSDRIMNRYGDTPEGMVESALEFIRIAEDQDFREIIISMKSSNPKVMVHAYRLLVAALAAHGEPYPIHLGVTEAGDGEDGRIKGASGIGALLEDGIGDTIRVSLTEDPVAEIPVARALAHAYEPPTFCPPVSLPARPDEAVTPYEYRRRVAEIVRLGGPDGVPVGGGQLPRVLAPARIPSDDAGHSDPDAAVADDGLFSQLGERIATRPQVSVSIPFVRAAAGSLVSVPAGALVLLDLPASEQATALSTTLHALPAEALVGIAEPGPLGITRAYRLLAACDEALFSADERQSPGSGVRHAICLALPLESDPLRIAATAGGLLIDGIGDALYLPAAERPVDLAFTLLQAVKARVTRADYVACPSCGRTLFDLMEVTEHIRAATRHLDGVTIAIMGCIVNGPGEMADADFGFVGSGPNKITLYRGKEPVRRNIPFDGAREALIDLIKEHGMWKEPS